MTAIPLFPLNTVLFPGGHLPLQIFEVRYLDMIKKCVASDAPFGVVSLLEGAEVRKPGQDEVLSDVGTLAQIVESAIPMAGLMRVKCTGTARFQVLASERLKNGLWMAEVETVEFDNVVDIPADQQRVANALGALIRSLQQRQTPPDQMPMMAPYRLDECGWVANRWCELLSFGIEEKMRLLTQENPLLRLELVHDVLAENGLLDDA